RPAFAASRTIAAAPWPAAARAAATAGLDAAARVVGGTLLARLAEDLADAVAVVVHAFARNRFARLARQRHQQFLPHRLGRDLLLDVGLDVRQAHRVALAGEADRVALGAQPRGA